jgi:hypothetical protein
LSAQTLKSSGAGLNFITAIINSELEANTAQLLFSHGNNIIFRAVTYSALENYLNQNHSQLQIIYSKDFAPAAAINKLKAKFSKITFIEVAENFDPSSLLTQASQNERQPLLINNPRLTNLYSIIGTSNSPGISTIANQIAARVKDSSLFFTPTNGIRPQVSSNTKAVEISSEKLDYITRTTGTLILDAGSTSALTSSLSDRRTSGQLLNWALNSSAKLLYVLKADENGIYQLSRFMTDYQNLIAPPPVVYILNHQRFDSKARLLNTQFKSLMMDKSYFQIPFDYSAAGKYPAAKGWFANTFTKQLDLISRSLA